MDDRREDNKVLYLRMRVEEYELVERAFAKERERGGLLEARQAPSLTSFVRQIILKASNDIVAPAAPAVVLEAATAPPKKKARGR